MTPDRSAARYLASRTRLGMKFGLETTRALVDAMGHPERAYPTLLVAGTNGKGSVVAYADAVLRASGLRSGRYTSPHLVSVHERIAVGGRPIGAAAFARAVARVRAAAERLVRAGGIEAHPTFFETLTVAAFDHFKRRGVDAAVLEVGMGGRLDATNVSEPLASAIVSIGRDHEQFLGATEAAIAGEKAGVLRARRAAVLGPMSAAARRAIERRARALGARLVDAESGSTFREEHGLLTLATPRGRYRGLAPLPGAHQRANLLVAIRLLEEAREAGLPVDLRAVPEAVAGTRWPGRLQTIPGRPPLLLDGAHNPAAALALAAHVRDLRPFVLLFGVMADKDIAGLARALFPLAHDIVLTRPAVGRAATPAAIAHSAGPLAARARRVAHVGQALARARRLAQPSRTVVVAGSLYLVGEVLRLVTRARK